MTALSDNRRWAAYAIEAGTRECLYFTADTKEQLDTLLFGRAYPAIRETVTYTRIGEVK